MSCNSTAPSTLVVKFRCTVLSRTLFSVHRRTVLRRSVQSPVYNIAISSASISTWVQALQGSYRFGILAIGIGATCANGDKNGANDDPLAPMVNPIAIGANTDRH